MSTVPSLSYLQLDSNYDPVFDTAVMLTGGAAVGQAILTRLKLFYGEWWEDLNLGLPVFQSMLGQPDSPNSVKAMALIVQRNIEGTPYVTAVNSVNISFVNGTFKFSASAETVFGPITVSNLPGESAILE